jgi:protein phosphatase PTC7
MITTLLSSLALNPTIRLPSTEAARQWRATLWISSPLIALPSHRTQLRRYHVAVPAYGTITPSPDNLNLCISKCPYRFETGYALQPKRQSRPFPPPFVSPPSSSFSEPLTTYSQSHDRRASVGGELIRGLTNGDDAILAAENFIGVNDGVGAWATKPHGNAA